MYRFIRSNVQRNTKIFMSICKINAEAKFLNPSNKFSTLFALQFKERGFLENVFSFLTIQPISIF